MKSLWKTQHPVKLRWNDTTTATPFVHRRSSNSGKVLATLRSCVKQHCGTTTNWSNKSKIPEPDNRLRCARHHDVATARRGRQHRGANVRTLMASTSASPGILPLLMAPRSNRSSHETRTALTRWQQLIARSTCWMCCQIAFVKYRRRLCRSRSVTIVFVSLHLAAMNSNLTTHPLQRCDVAIHDAKVSIFTAVIEPRRRGRVCGTTEGAFRRLSRHTAAWRVQWPQHVVVGGPTSRGLQKENEHCEDCY